MSKVGAGIFDALKMGSMTLPNRIVMSPMTRARSGPEMVPGDEVAKYYTQRASAGLIISEGTFTSEQAIGWVEAPGIYQQEQVEVWKKVTASVHAAGGRIFCQLWHCGRASDASFRPNSKDGRGVAPSPVALKGIVHAPRGKVQGEVPRELTTEEVEKIPEEYRKAALLSKEAGFDGVEIHCANGYLLDTFLQTSTNVRTDKYGGSNENRFRLIGEVLDAVLTVFPSTSVGVRFSPNGAYNDMGSKDFKEIFTYYTRRVNDFNLAYLHLIIGLGFGFHELGEAMTMSDFRGLYDGILMVNCGYTKELAEKEIGDGETDCVSFGRPYITNPDLVERFKTSAELAPGPPPSVWYGSQDPISKGFTEYPAMNSA